jgi:hypothetical protein
MHHTAWHPKRGDGRKELIQNWQVITYFDKLTAEHKLRQQQVNSLEEVEDIQWYEPPPPGDYAQ